MRGVDAADGAGVRDVGTADADDADVRDVGAADADGAGVRDVSAADVADVLHADVSDGVAGVREARRLLERYDGPGMRVREDCGVGRGADVAGMDSIGCGAR